MGAKSYKNREKQITLGDGETKIKVRRLMPKEFTESGIIPDILFDPMADPVAKKKAAEDARLQEELYKIAFLKAVVPQDDFKPVAEYSVPAVESEMTLEDLYPEDKMLIMVYALGGGAGVMSETFPATNKEPEKA